MLAQHSRVREATVIVKEGRTGDKRLVAYVVLQENAPTPSDLRTYLKIKLPGYMLPSSFVFLDSLPLTFNGKVDRMALPETGREHAEGTETNGASRNAIEESIAAIWSAVLGIERIGLHDNFFALGGHSLKAAQVVARVRAAFQSEIPLRLVFEYPTIAELAAVIDSLKKNTVDENKLDRVLSEVAALSEAEAQRFLAEKLDGPRGEQQN